MRNILLLGIMATSLSGCALAFHAANGTLKDVVGLSEPRTVHVGPLGDGTGFQPATLNIDIPGKVCDRAAFIDGFKDDYVVAWNKLVHAKINSYQAQGWAAGSNKQKRGKRAAVQNVSAQQNALLYQAHIIGTKGYVGSAHKYNYSERKLNGGDYCPANAYVQGKNAAAEAVERERAALLAREI